MTKGITVKVTGSPHHDTHNVVLEPGATATDLLHALELCSSHFQLITRPYHSIPPDADLYPLVHDNETILASPLLGRE